MEERRLAQGRRKDEIIVPRCALCKAEYDTVAALAEHLVVAPEDPDMFMAKLAARSGAESGPPTSASRKAAPKPKRASRNARDAAASTTAPPSAIAGPLAQ